MNKYKIQITKKSHILNLYKDYKFNIIMTKISMISFAENYNLNKTIKNIIS